MNNTLFPLRNLPSKKKSIEEQIDEAQLPEPLTEYFFAKPIGRQWRFDYCWPDQRIALEVEGLAFGRMVETKDGKKVRAAGGRHATGAGMQADCEKYSWAAILGWTVIRATTTMVRRGEAIELLKHAFSFPRKDGTYVAANTPRVQAEAR